MQPSIHIAVTACHRPHLTRRTVASLAKHNDLSEFFCWYGIDGNHHPDEINVLDAAGFTRLVLNDRRYGPADLTGKLLAQVAIHASEDDYVLLLQNDWLCVRPIPVKAIRALLDWPNVGCFRLYGQYKERNDAGARHECNPRHAGLEGMPVVEWLAHNVAGEDIEIGCIHWGHPPAVTKLPLAVRLTRNAQSERTSVNRSGREGFLTARVTENVFWHIGRKKKYRKR